MNKALQHLLPSLLCAALLPLSAGVSAGTSSKVAKPTKSPAAATATNMNASIPFQLSNGETVRFRALQEVAGCHNQVPVILVKKLDGPSPGTFLMVGCSKAEVHQYGEGLMEQADGLGQGMAAVRKDRMNDYVAIAKGLAAKPEVQGLLAKPEVQGLLEIARAKLAGKPPASVQEEPLRQASPAGRPGLSPYGVDSATVAEPVAPVSQIGTQSLLTNATFAAAPAPGPTIMLGNSVDLESLSKDDHVSIRFQAAPDAAIDPSTVKVMIGGKDKTLQFRMIADISERGIEASLKHVPAGRQEVQIRVQDTKKREAVLKAMVNVKA